MYTLRTQTTKDTMGVYLAYWWSLESVVNQSNEIQTL